MTEYRLNRATEQELGNLHGGLHQAMDALIRRNDRDEAERILRQVDQRLSVLINSAKPL